MSNKPALNFAPRSFTEKPDVTTEDWSEMFSQLTRHLQAITEKNQKDDEAFSQFVAARNEVIKVLRQHGEHYTELLAKGQTLLEKNQALLDVYIQKFEELDRIHENNERVLEEQRQTIAIYARIREDYEANLVIPPIPKESS